MKKCTLKSASNIQHKLKKRSPLLNKAFILLNVMYFNVAFLFFQHVSTTAMQ